MPLPCPLLVYGLGLGLCPIPRMAPCRLSECCLPIRGVDSRDLGGLLNLAIPYFLQFHLGPAAAVPSTWHLPFQKGT